MSVNLRSKAAGWLQEHWDELYDLVCLGAAVLLAEHLFVGLEVPWRAVLCAVLVADAVPMCSALAGRSARRTFLMCLPSYAFAAVATGFLWHFVFRLPLASLEIFPVWLALNWIHRVGYPAYAPRLSAWISRHAGARAQTLPLETAALGAAFYLAASLVPGFWPGRTLPVVICLAWPAARFATGRLISSQQPGSEWLRLGIGYLALAAASAGALALCGGRFTRPDAVLLAWCAIGLACARAAGAAAFRKLPDPLSAITCWILVGTAGLWLMKGYATFTLEGAGDARWYATMLADMLAQVHAGVFPVWMGQSVTQFNGAIYPLRIAPGFHYLGALLDALTLRALGVVALQNLLVTAVGVATIFSAYFGLARLIPGRRWLAAALAFLFLACPGVLGMAYKSDLLMSWTTLPWVALAWFATIRSFRKPDSCPTMLLLGASLGMCWWGHSPIALWMTLIAAAAQAARLAASRPGPASWAHALAGAGLFAAIAAFPIGSVLFFPPEPGMSVDAFQGATGKNIANFIREVFPQVILPLTPGGHDLGDLQLGYSLWAMLLFCLWNFWRERLLSVGIALGAALVLTLLLIPIPGLNLALWNAIPALVRNPTSNWAMNRLYLPLAGAIVYGAAAMMAGAVPGSRAPRRAFAALLAAGCAWSMAEATKMLPKGTGPALTAEGAVDVTRPENVMLTRFAYFIFPAPPDVFTHGVTDPEMENRLRSADTLSLTATNYGAAKAGARVMGSGAFGPFPGSSAGFLQLDKTLRIEPGRRYLLDFDFPERGDTHGVIEIFGRGFFREYALPEYGGSRAFGAGGEHNSLVAVSTSEPEPVDLALRFFPEKPPAGGKPGDPAIRVRLLLYDPSTLPIRLDSLIPYRVRVRSPTAGWLETPRMHQLGYAATVNGAAAPVRRAPDGLTWIGVPAGDSRVELDFGAPFGLQALFWLSLASIAAAAAAAARAAARMLA